MHEEQDGSTTTNAALEALDAAASLLVDIDPADPAGVAALSDALTGLVACAALPTAAREELDEAAAVFKRAARKNREIPGALAAVGRAVESAARFARAASAESEPAAGEAADEALPSDADPFFVQEFITESRENIHNSEAALLALETNPDDLESVNVVFRAFHTIKGTSMWLGLRRISELAHGAESLLSRVREREIRCTGGYADLALRATDTLRDLVNGVQVALDGGRMETPPDYDALLALLADPEAAGVSDEPTHPVAPPRLGDLLVAQGKADREAVESALVEHTNEPVGVALVRGEAASLTDVAGALRTQRRMMHGDQGVESSVRVRTDRLDRLIDMVGELVIAHSMVSQDPIVLSGSSRELHKKVAHAGKIVRELQDLGLLMRMVPLKSTFQKIARLVRDLALNCGKSVSLVVEGEDTEIDRNMVDVIGDPLVHMIRNAVDHGIESPDVRADAGKPAGGTVRLAAYHSGGNVVIEMRDDGKGLDRDRILEKAVQRGLVEPGRELTDAQVFALIFEPGFSTAEKLTDVSGRGVGMDVVKRRVEAIKGRIEIASERGKGTTFTLRLPLTLAITDGMLVRVGAERYILPTSNIAVSLRPEAAALSSIAGRGEMLSLRGELLPLFRLHRLFGIEGATQDPTAALTVVVDAGAHRCALLVDELLGKQQVVAKSLGGGIKVKGIAGGAILGDGRVGLILDPIELVALARETPAAALVGAA